MTGLPHRSFAPPVVLMMLFLTGMFQSVNAQNNFTIRQFDETTGLSSNFTEGVVQAETGHLYIASKGGLDKFDGTSFEQCVHPGDTSLIDHVTAITEYEGRIWYGLFDGRIGCPEIECSEAATGIRSQVRHLFVDRDEGLWAFSRSGSVIWANVADTQRYDLSGMDLLVNAVIPYKHKEFIVGSNDGMLLMRFEDNGKAEILRKIGDVLQTKITAMHFEPEKDRLWVGTEDIGTYIITSPFGEDQNISKFKLKNGHSLDEVQDIHVDNRGRIWFGTFGQGLIRVEFLSEGTERFIVQRFDESIDSEHLIKEIFEDAENNIWIATFGGGLFQVIENIFHHPFDEEWLRQQSITQLYRDSKGSVWLGIDKGIYRTSEHVKDAHYQYFHAGGHAVSAITESRSGAIWIGTENSGIYRLGSGTDGFVKVPLKDGLSDAVNSLLTTNDGTVYVSTKAGLYRISAQGRILDHWNTLDGLPHNNVRFCYLDSNKNLWIATQGNRVAYLSDGALRFLESGSSQKIVDVNHILQDKLGRLWFATLGNGIFVLDDGDAYNISSENGLPSNYCYQMVLDNDGYVWVSHQKSLVQVSPERNISRVVGHSDISQVENTMITFLFKDNEGNIWITSTHGVVKFNPAIDKASKSVPQLSISNMKLFDQEHHMVDGMVLPYDRYKVTFTLAGIALRNPESIRYKYQLLGYSDYWSEVQQSNLIQIPRLEEGSYTLKVIASKNNGEWTPTPATFNFVIQRPFYKTWMFVLLMVIGIGGGVVVFVRYRTYRLMKDKQELEMIVTERTVEIQDQKEEIERSRDEIAKYAKDITDSIKYAKRIQNAIFPKMDDVQKVLPESFVLFRSKDLVSGDFYFAEQSGDDRIFCAVDCTGHGVPGGFMSIVANNLLQQAINQLGMTKPSEILNYLNHGVTHTLHQTYEESTVKDGMDLALCTWNTKTHKVQFAGAYNPVYIFSDGELTELKGDRFPVGTFIGEQIREFTNREVQLKKGDMIYLFSDGYSDQFGGSEGKKLKVRRFRELLKSIHHLPVKEQYDKLYKHLRNWMREYEQVDDIVVMGVRIS